MMDLAISIVYIYIYFYANTAVWLLVVCETVYLCDAGMNIGVII